MSQIPSQFIKNFSMGFPVFVPTEVLESGYRIHIEFLNTLASVTSSPVPLVNL